MSIKKRLIVTLAIIMAAMIGISVFAVLKLSEVNMESTIIAEQIIPELNDANEVNFYIARFRSCEYQHIVLTSEDEMTTLEKKMDDYQNLIDQKFQKMKEEGDTGVDEATSTWESYKSEHADFVKLSRNMDTEGCKKLILGDMKTQYDALAEYAQNQVKAEKQNAQSASKEGDQKYVVSMEVLIVVCVIALILSFLMGILLLIAILKPLKAFQNELTELAGNGGDLTKTIDIKSKDEMGDMAKALNAFLQNLREIISEVNKNANAVLESSEHVRGRMESLNGNISDSSATIQELSAGMEETAASAEEVNSSSEEIVESVSSMAERASKGAELVLDISKRAAELKHSATNSRGVAVGTYEKSKQQLEIAIKKAEAIEQITLLSNSILEISDQTNLLALNASIEAARAGEAGRGFAVVAGEIGNLADNSKKTVTEIQKITSDVVEAVRELSKDTISLIEFMDSTVIGDYDSFVNVGDAYGKDASFVDDMVTEISATSQELSATVENIMNAIEDVASAMNQGASGTQDVAQQVTEIAQIAEEVDAQSQMSAENAQKLKKTVGKFIV